MKVTILILIGLQLVYSGLNAQTRPSRDEMMASSKASESLLDKPFIFERGTLKISGDDASVRSKLLEAIAQSDQVIEEYSSKMTEFIATKPSPAILQSRLNKVKVKAKSTDELIARVAKVFKEEHSISMVYYLQELYLLRGFLQNVIRIYPEEILLKDNLNKVTQAISGYVSREKFMDNMETNQKNYIKNLRLSPAAQQNPTIENFVKNKFQTIEGNGITVTKVNITDATWNIIKNELDIPVYRRMSACMAIKNSDGSCGIATTMVRQEYQGAGTYGETTLYLPSPVTIIPCDNLK